MKSAPDCFEANHNQTTHWLMSNSIEMATKCNSSKATGKNCRQTWPLFQYTQLSNYRVTFSWKDPARAGIFTLTLGNICSVSFWGFVCLRWRGRRWQHADSCTLAGRCGQKKENKVRRMCLLHEIFNSQWCICPSMCHPKVHLTLEKSN